MKKILSIVWYKVLPARFGGQKGIALFNKYLSQYHPLVCLCSSNNEPADDVLYKVIPELPVSKLQFILPSIHRKVKEVALREKPDYIIVEHPYHGLAGWKAKKASGAQLIIHSHNIEFERFRLLGKWWWRLLRRYEKWVHQHADLNLFKNVSDLSFAIKEFQIDPLKCMVIPYGIEPKETPADSNWVIRQRHGIGDDEKILVFAGTLDYTPNAEAVTMIVQEIIPRLKKSQEKFRLIICGKNLASSFKTNDPTIIIAGEVNDIERYFGAADVFINPVTYGGGVQTKNMDALAANCNVVCFDSMIEREICRLAGRKVFTARNGDWEDFANQIQIASFSKTNTPTGFFEEYNWPNITRRLTDKLAKATNA